MYGDLSSFDFRSTVSFGKDGPYRIDNGAKVTFSKGSFTLLNDGDYLIADMAELAGERLYYVLVRA